MAIDVNKIARQKRKREKVKPHSGQNLISEVLNRDFSLSKKLNDKKKSRFYSELAILLKSGIDIKTALEIAVEGKEKTKEKALFSAIKQNVVKGGSLSNAIHESTYFSDYEFYSLRIGEESGQVVKVLEDLAAYFTQKQAQRRKIINTFSYPIIVLVVAIGAVLFMLNFIVPMFRDIFKRFGGDLPALTQLVLDLSDAIGAYGYWVLLLILAIIITAATQKRKAWYRKLTSSLLLRLPLFGELTKKIYISRFSHSMHLLTQAKNPLLNSIQLVKKMVNFYPLEKALENIEDEVMHGKPLYKCMEQHAIFDRKTTSLIKVGEEVNQLELIFQQIDEQNQKDIDHQTEVIGSLLEPFLIIFVGGFVAVMLIAMYLPLFKLGTSIF